jgi:uncharacterized lipoprotein YehR (DUF1307 family)
MKFLIKILLVILLVGCTKKEEPKPTSSTTTTLSKVSIDVSYCYGKGDPYVKNYEAGHYYKDLYNIGDKIDWALIRESENSFSIDGHDLVTNLKMKYYDSLFIQVTVIRNNPKLSTYYYFRGDKNRFTTEL